MYTDAQLRCSNGQSLAGAATTTVSTNVIDLLSANRNLGRGYPMRAIVIVGTAFTGGTSVQCQMIQSANADMSGSSVIATGPVTTDANATAGTKLMDQSLNDNLQRYIGFQYVTVGTHTAGTVGFAGLVDTTDAPNTLPAVTGY